MEMLLLIMFVMVLVPVFFVWMPLITKVWAKIVVTLCAIWTARFLIASLTRLSDIDDELRVSNESVGLFMWETETFVGCISEALEQDWFEPINECNLSHYEFARDVLVDYYSTN